MKYKAIKAMAHNWTHSFFSSMNYVDGDFVSDDVYRLARSRKGEKVVITWIPDSAFDLPDTTDRLRKSIEMYRQKLVEYISKSGVSLIMVKEMRTEVLVTESLQIQVRCVTVDDRGRIYNQYVGV